MALTTKMTEIQKDSYILVLYLNRKTEIRVGKLGLLTFPRGYYVYTGSALGPGGLSARLRHHLYRTARPHWHIDYLRRFALLKEVWISNGPERLEHAWAKALQRLEGASIPAPGFGSSDCKCPTHLFCFDGYPLSEKFNSK
jgi:Uri superfamily endonuclease